MDWLLNDYNGEAVTAAELGRLVALSIAYLGAVALVAWMLFRGR